MLCCVKIEVLLGGPYILESSGCLNMPKW